MKKIMNRRSCSECKHRIKTYDSEFYCQKYRHWLTEDNKQITGWDNELCEFEEKEEDNTD